MAYYSSYSVDRIGGQRRRRGRLSVTVLWAVMLALFISTGSASADATWVTVCHEGSTTSVEDSSLNGHLKHGDTLGACQQTPQQICETAGDNWVNGVCKTDAQLAEEACLSPNTWNGSACLTPEQQCTSPNAWIGGACLTPQQQCVAPNTWNGTSCDPYVAPPTTVTCGPETTEPGEHDLPYTCVDKVVCGGGEHRDPSTNTCVPNGNSGDDEECDEGFHYDESEEGCVENGASGDLHGKSDCDAANGTFSQGVCTVQVCIAGVVTPVNLNDAGNVRRAVDGSCPSDKCPDALNPGYQEPEATCTLAAVDACPDEALNPGVQDAGPCNVASSNSGSSNAGGSNPGSGEAPFVDPGVDVDHGNSVLAVGALAAPFDGGASAEVLGAQAAAGGGAAATDEDAVLAEGDDLPVTGMSPMGTVLAALVAMFVGAFSYGEAARASRRRRAVRAAA